MFTTLTREQADRICQIANVKYHHHDSMARSYEGYEQPYIHFYSEQYGAYVFRVGIETGEIKFKNEDRIVELEKMSESLYQNLIDANVVIDVATEEHKKTQERIEIRNKLKYRILEYLNGEFPLTV
jgi:diphthamide synthase (EF-2-diphthine--ammonia ligase)